MSPSTQEEREVAMNAEEVAALERALEALLSLSQRDDALKSALRQLARRVLEATEAPSVIETPSGEETPIDATLTEDVGRDEMTPEPASAEAEAEVEVEVERTPEVPSDAPPPPPPPREPLIELTLGRAAPRAPKVVSGPREDPLRSLIERCQASARAARRVVAHERGERPEGATTAEDRAAVERLAKRIAWARALDAWMEGLIPRIETLGACHEVLAEALELAREESRGSETRPRSAESILSLLAEAQAMLRVAVGHVGGPPDPDQLAVFDWLKQTAAQRQVFVPRFMREQDKPDIAKLEDLRARLRREKDRRAATTSTRPATPETRPRSSPNYGPNVHAVAKLLAGKTVVLIGGECRPEAQQALEMAFRLRELVWDDTRVHQSIERFEHTIARPDVAAVLLAIRWSSHSFGEVKVLCDRHGKPLVRLPGGYSPNQVAEQVLSQASGHLHPAKGPA